MIQIKPNRVTYLLTPTGIAEKARMSRAYLQASMQFYSQARSRIRERFAQLSAECPTPDGPDCRKRVVFLGAGEVAEIGFICLQETDLQLVGVVDKDRRSPFFDVPVIENVTALAEAEFDKLVVMSFDNSESILAELESRRFPLERVFWV